MQKRLQPKKIRGVSFHYKRQGVERKNTVSEQLSEADILRLSAQIAQDTPQPLNEKSIRRLHADQGRNELHTHVSHCVDLIAKWSGIVQLLERYLPLPTEDGQNPQTTLHSHVERHIELLVEAKRILFLWKHRLCLCEMIADMQKTLYAANRN